MKLLKIQTKITIYEYILLFFCLYTIISLGTLPLKIFYPYPILAISLTLTTILTKFLKLKRPRINLRNNFFLIIIILAGLFLRLKPYQYIMGGQDQGTYVNISHQYNKSKTLYVVDDYRKTLTEKQQQIYDGRGNYIMPSIEKWNREGSEYSMVFYPAYPSTLGVFEILLGQNSMFYTLTLFSIITLANIYLIAQNLTKNKNTSLLIILLFALNPVHVFFSKLPVGEMAALSFITTGTYFLTRYLRSPKEQQHKTIYLLFSLLGFLIFSLARMTFFIYIPIFILVALFAWKNEKERKYLSIYTLLNFVILTFSYIYYKILLYPLFLKIYPRTLVKMFENYFPINTPVTIKIIFTVFTAALILVANIKINIKDRIKKFVYPAFLSIGLFSIYKILMETKRDLRLILFRQTGRYDRWNLLDRGFDGIKHVPLISISNYVGILLFLVFIFILIRSLINKRLNKYHFLVFISLYFLFIYIEKSGLMRYDYYNSRYYLTEVIPMILLTTGIYLGELIQKGGWHKKIALVILSLTLIYFSIFSFFQIGKVEGNEMDFYNYIDSTVSDNDLIIFVNQNIYESKYPKNFNDYVAGPLKYFFDKKVLVLEHPEEIPTPIVQSFFDERTHVYYISNVPLENYEFATQEQKMTFDYNYFNNSPGCNYHNYEFLDTKKVTEIPLPDSIKCKLLPNAYFEKYRDFYFGVLK